MLMHNSKQPRGNPKSPGQRYTLTLRGIYAEVLNDMVEKGVYLEPQDALRAGLRLLFEKHGVELYVKNSAD
jgi:Arc/MetJ-type ribon-helix-helix transcriptional regulator